MLQKILSFLLVYILSILNFIVVLSPLTFLVLGKYFLATSARGHYVESLVFLSISSTTALMLIFLFLDFCFSSSVRYYAKRSVLITKDDKYKDIAEKYNDFYKMFGWEEVDTIFSVGASSDAVLTQEILDRAFESGCKLAE